MGTWGCLYHTCCCFRANSWFCTQRSLLVGSEDQMGFWESNSDSDKPHARQKKSLNCTITQEHFYDIKVKYLVQLRTYGR